ncbi:hypothetical protein RDWZM_001369 [Blomia tropicalis]|uniref:Uncharacterized protein n=1 Tax=Blomia tropicalis TaxID=40697 RepID=A0A9Q0MBV2_BLOTA|nr:hypothetical protein RDWZM_001369 [Blomia tropicalis]
MNVHLFAYLIYGGLIVFPLIHSDPIYNLNVCQTATPSMRKAFIINNMVICTSNSRWFDSFRVYNLTSNTTSNVFSGSTLMAKLFPNDGRFMNDGTNANIEWAFQYDVEPNHCKLDIWKHDDTNLEQTRYCDRVSELKGLVIASLTNRKLLFAQNNRNIDSDSNNLTYNVFEIQILVNHLNHHGLTSSVTFDQFNDRFVSLHQGRDGQACVTIIRHQGKWNNYKLENFNRPLTNGKDKTPTDQANVNNNNNNKEKLDSILTFIIKKSAEENKLKSNESKVIPTVKAQMINLAKRRSHFEIDNIKIATKKLQDIQNRLDQKVINSNDFADSNEKKHWWHTTNIPTLDIVDVQTVDDDIELLSIDLDQTESNHGSLQTCDDGDFTRSQKYVTVNEILQEQEGNISDKEINSMKAQNVKSFETVLTNSDLLTTTNCSLLSTEKDSIPIKTGNSCSPIFDLISEKYPIETQNLAQVLTLMLNSYKRSKKETKSFESWYSNNSTSSSLSYLVEPLSKKANVVIPDNLKNTSMEENGDKEIKDSEIVVN